ncbi:nSTAND1 domain-containing NTPase [Kamptonema formosum]|uniref:nSTAND1 domain-containing NTPase n=1 Tax=Kamptonema formosum TaxID=331992 RepID=UPI00034DDE46|nr:pentapeptide repeat-containing protein [Kamptonema formosum]
MTISPDSESASTPEPITQIRQDTDNNQGQVIAQMIGGFALGQLIIHQSQTQTLPKTIETATDSVELGENPYQGLKPFWEMDGDRFFGRDIEINKLWSRFQELYGDRTKIRVLPIYGPSGSGKSSLARAGLIPALGKQPLPGKDRGRVVVLTPGNDPLEALATVLARIATKDETPVAKTREFKQELLELNEKQEFDGLRRIANVLPDIAFAPLIVLVDQFEELYTYTLCNDEQVRSAFVENLLCAASDSSQRVSVIITMRSDFLGKTQQHPRLNQLFSSQGFLVPIMQPEELAIAITEPAKQKGYELDKATVQLLVEQSKGQEGALPLLQFALTQIWEGLRNKIEPADTLKQIGGVGGALANKAKSLYESLNTEQQKIARSTFLALIQLNDDHTATRRRAPISELITSKQDEPLVREVIERFADPGVWILVTFSNEQQVEMVEVAHEALIHKWKELQEWLKEHWENLRNKRKIEQSAFEWQDNRKSKDYLLQGRRLRDAREFIQAQKDNAETSLCGLAKEFVKASVKKHRINTLKSAPVLLVLSISILGFVHLQIIGRANSILSRDDCKADFEIKGLLEYMWWTRYANGLRDVKLCNEDLFKVQLPRIYILNANFDMANLSNSNFRGSRLPFSSFKGATLLSTDFSGKAVLTGADFGCNHSECATLFKANFENSNLSDANFQGAFLEEAIFKGSNLTRAKLDAAEGLTEEQLQDSILCDTGTRRPG